MWVFRVWVFGFRGFRVQSRLLFWIWVWVVLIWGLPMYALEVSFGCLQAVINKAFQEGPNRDL